MITRTATNERLPAASMHANVESLRQYQGPMDTRRYADVATKGRYTWRYGSVEEDDGDTWIAPANGGGIGMWELLWRFVDDVPDTDTADITLPFVLDRDMYITVDESLLDDDGVFALNPAATGHSEGKTAIFFVPAGVATRSIMAGPLNVTGPVLDPDYDWEVKIRFVRERFSGESNITRALGSGAPTVVSAASSGGTTLVITFSEAAYVTSPDAPTGLTIGYSSGTPPTITAVSGNGTTEHTYTLSGALDSSKSPTFTVAATSIYDENGVAMATGSTSIAIAYMLPNAVHRWRASDRTLNGSDVASVADSSGHALAVALAQATAGNQPAYAASSAAFNNQATITHAAGDDEFLAATQTGATPSAVTVAVVFRLLDSGVADQAIIAAAGVSGSFDPNIGYWLGHNTSAGGTFVFNASNAAGTAATEAFALTTPILVVCRQNASRREIRINDVLVAEVTEAAGGWGSITSIAVGKLTNGAFFYGRMEWAEIQVTHDYTDAANITAMQSYAVAKYGLSA